MTFAFSTIINLVAARCHTTTQQLGSQKGATQSKVTTEPCATPQNSKPNQLAATRTTKTSKNSIR